MSGLLANAGGWFRRRQLSPLVSAACLLATGWFLFAVLQCYVPGKGFTYLIAFGSAQENRMLSKVRKLHPYVQRESSGYDAQFYAQVAMDPSLQNRELAAAVDNLPYRGRRVLFAATAWALGLGRPAWILQAFALQNVLGWLLLGGLLLHWWPPRTWDNFLRWAGVMFCSGLCISVHNALFDGPSLLLLAFGMFLLEKGRPWWSAAVLGLAGLGKETNLAGAVILVPPGRVGGRHWFAAAGQALLVILPLALWLYYIFTMVGRVNDAGKRNFALPFTGYLHKWREVITDTSPGAPSWMMLIMITLTVQGAFLLLRPRWSNPWWRIGATFALLLVCLGDAVWEGYPGAASRVLLPMQLAFNLLVPVGRWWRVLLIAGNLTVWSAPEAMAPPPGEICELAGPHALMFNPAGVPVSVQLGPNWLGNEGVRGRTWAWAQASAEFTVDNPQDTDLEADLSFGLVAPAPRPVTVRLNGAEIWSGEVSTKIVPVAAGGIVLHPGPNRLEFLTVEPGVRVGSDPRALAFSLHDARLELRRLRPAGPP